VTVETTPAFLGGLGELVDHGERGFFERHPLERTVRWRTVANELSMTLVRVQVLPMLNRQVVEGKQRVAWPLWSAGRAG